MNLNIVIRYLLQNNQNKESIMQDSKNHFRSLANTKWICIEGSESVYSIMWWLSLHKTKYVVIMCIQQYRGVKLKKATTYLLLVFVTILRGVDII